MQYLPSLALGVGIALHFGGMGSSHAITTYIVLHLITTRFIVAVAYTYLILPLLHTISVYDAAISLHPQTNYSA